MIMTNETHCIVSRVDGDDNGTNLNIRMKLDGIFSYFPTRKLTMDELEECEYIETVYLARTQPNGILMMRNMLKRKTGF